MATDLESPEFKYLAGLLCLDFCNTVSERPGFRAKPQSASGDYFSNYGDLLRWCVGAQIIPPTVVEKLANSSRTFPQIAEQALRHAKSVREQLFQLFCERTLHGKFAPAHLEQLNSLLRTLPPRFLAAQADEFDWQWRIEEGNFECMLPPVIMDAAEALTSIPLERLRICADEDCSWLFLDTSKNGKRKWCDMADCGNRDKVRRFYKRQA